MHELLIGLSSEIYDLIKDELITESIFDIKDINGNNSNAPRACKKGSSVYILYSNNNSVLYVGETGVSIKSRCFGDGSGAHCKKDWFNDVDSVSHYTKDNESEFNEKERKFIEQALSITLEPTYYGANTK